MEKTAQWVISQGIHSDVVVKVGDETYPLHKFMLVAKSGYLRTKIMESNHSEQTCIVDISEIPGGVEAFEKVTKFCYGVNFEITINNVAVLRCAAEFLEMKEMYFEGNLANRTEEFLNRAAMKSLPSTVAVLRSCERLLPMAEQLNIVQRCVDALSMKVCIESKFPTRSPEEWWAYELAGLSPAFLQKTLAAVKSRGASNEALAIAVSAHAEKKIPDILAGKSPPPPGPTWDDARAQQRKHLESVVSLLPDNAPFSVSFLCCLLRAAIFLDSPTTCRKELEKRISAALDQATVNDLLSVTLDYSGERIVDMDSVRRVVAAFVEREALGGVLYGGGAVCCSGTMQQVAKTVDAFVGEIATDEDLSVSKFTGIAGVIPKTARRFDDDLYRAIDIYLKAHPGLDEIEREKVCSVMDPLKLSYEARLHASQNKRLPLQITLHAIYYDQLNLRSGSGVTTPGGGGGGGGDLRSQIVTDSALIKENEALRSELSRMKMYVSDIQKTQPAGAARGPKKLTLLSSFSKTLGKLNPFRQEAKDTSHIVDGAMAVKPRRRRFSIS